MNNTNNEFLEGFMAKCAQRGVNPDALIAWAKRGSSGTSVLRDAGNAALQAGVDKLTEDVNLRDVTSKGVKLYNKATKSTQVPPVIAENTANIVKNVQNVRNEDDPTRKKFKAVKAVGETYKGVKNIRQSLRDSRKAKKNRESREAANG